MPHTPFDGSDLSRKAHPAPGNSWVEWPIHRPHRDLDKSFEALRRRSGQDLPTRLFDVRRTETLQG